MKTSQLEFCNITWPVFEKDCINLAKKVKKFNIDKIVSISRGGLVASRILSDLLSISISHITISSYLDLKKQKRPYIEETPQKSLNYKTILIVDEVSDTGQTLKKAVKYFKTQKVNRILTATLYIKSKTAFIPNFYIKKIDSWIIFPYELKETAKSFLKIFKSNEKTVKKLEELGFSKKLVKNIISL
jgi:hypoxanthine phosphoribosyltransferase